MGRLGFLQAELDAIRDQGLLNTIRTVESAQGAWFTVNGRRVLNLCSNNYLGLADEHTLKEAAKAAIDKFGVGPGAVRSISGTQALHLELEDRLAKFKGTEATILLQSGFTANTTTIPAITGEGDLIFSDELNHASIIDGCRLSKAKVIRYAHNDAADLDRQIQAAGECRRRLVITDGVFSMDGDLAPLPALLEVARKHDCMTMVDDAHGEGVLGDHGRGIVDHYGLVHEIDIEIGTLSKAFGVVGGYVAGSRLLIDYLKQRGRPFLFSTGPTPADVAACLAAVDLLEASDERVRKLWDNASYYRGKMQAAGFDTGKTETPITPIMIGDAAKASQLSRELFEANVYAQSISFPTVARGKARIRAMISAVHERKDLDYAVEQFTAVGRKLGIV